MTVVVEEPVPAARERVDPVHVLLDDARQGVDKGVARFPELEKHVGVVRHAAQLRMIGVQRPVAERLHGVPVQQTCQFVLFEHLDFLDFVRGAEAVEEMHERQAGLNGGKVRHRAQVHDILHGTGGEQRKTRLPDSHDVLMITENAQ